MKTATTSAIVLVSLTAFAACGGSQPAAEAPPPPAEPEAALDPVDVDQEAAPPAPEMEAPAEASKPVEVPFQAKSGSKLSGKAVLVETADGVKVSLMLENVSPGKHAAHVHEKGDCSAADGSSAGGHFNPGGHQHGLPSQSPRHLGDLGNVSIGKDGKGNHEISIAGANLKPDDPNSFMGRAIIVHEKEDDGGQPTGNAGGRIGCGEIK